MKYMELEVDFLEGNQIERSIFIALDGERKTITKIMDLGNQMLYEKDVNIINEDIQTFWENGFKDCLFLFEMSELNQK